MIFLTMKEEIRTRSLSSAFLPRILTENPLEIHTKIYSGIPTGILPVNTENTFGSPDMFPGTMRAF